jgi:hypothetical protein
MGALEDMFGNIGTFFKEWWFLIIPALIIFIVWYFFLRNLKPSLKQYNRRVIEKDRFLKRLELCKTNEWNWLYQGKELIGCIERMREGVLNRKDVYKDEINRKYNKTLIKDKKFFLIELSVRPYMKFLRFKIPNLFSKVAMIIDNEDLERNRSEKILVLNKDVRFDLHNDADIWLPTRYIKDVSKWIDREFIDKTDMYNKSVGYYTYGQMMTTYNPNFPQYAQEQAMEQKRTNTELAKRKGQTSTL